MAQPPRKVTELIRNAIKKAGGTTRGPAMEDWMRKLGLDTEVTPFSVLRALDGDIPNLTREDWSDLNKYLREKETIDQPLPYPEQGNQQATREALDRINEYQNTMRDRLLFSGMDELTNQRTGERGVTGTPSVLAGALEDARQAGIEPTTDRVRDRTMRLADSLNQGMREGQAPFLNPSDLVDIDWRLLQESVDLPMDEASRMARAREQGYVYGIDEDVWRGVPTGGNLRSAPGQSGLYMENLDDPEFLGNITQWGSSDPAIARSYAGFPQNIPVTRPMYLEDFANQDYLTGLPYTKTSDFNVPAGRQSAGTAMFRMAGRETPFEYRGQGERYSALLPEERVFVSGDQPWARIPGNRGWLPQEGHTDRVVNRLNTFTERVWGEEPTGVVFRNIVDPGANMAEVPSASDVYALPLSRVRNRDLAMFHPLLRGQPALLGSVAGAALLPYGTSDE